MKIQQIHVTNLKRFTDLTIQNIPETTKLVVLVGPNGCGKTSLFEAFNHWSRFNSFGNIGEKSYYNKEDLLHPNDNDSWYQNKVDISFHDREININEREKNKGIFYFRSAYRNDPEFTVSNLSMQGKPFDRIQEKLIKTDSKVSEDYQRLVSATLKGVYSGDDDNLSVLELRKKLLGKIQSSINNIFPDLELLDIGDPLEDGSFYFKKGLINKYQYQNLSAGEKSAFDLILDIIIKQEYYTDSIFCIDEPEIHMHTSLQEKVLDELYKAIPEKSQLWIATHSIGMLKKAKELNVQCPNTVSFLDFSDRNFDMPQFIEPSLIDKSIWKKFLELAFNDFADLIVPSTIVFCEGDLAATKNIAFDQAVYSKIFEKEYPEVSFISAGSCSQIESSDNISIKIIREISSKSQIIKLVDRDDKSTAEIDDCNKKGIRVLSKRHLECYLFDDELIRKLCSSVSKTEKIDECLNAKQTALTNSISRGNPSDDMKSASGEFYNSLKSILQLTQRGDKVHAFLRDTIAPLVTPDTKVYKELKECIFGNDKSTVKDNK